MQTSFLVNFSAKKKKNSTGGHIKCPDDVVVETALTLVMSFLASSSVLSPSLENTPRC